MVEFSRLCRFVGTSGTHSHERGLAMAATTKAWTWASAANGMLVTITPPEGKTVLLRGDAAAEFVRQTEQTTDEYTDADLCRENWEYFAG